MDDGTGTCVVTPGDCKDGTVLIGNECVDPTRGLVVDVEEGAEPNGLGVVEPSSNPAGQLTLKAMDQTLVVHGHITPFQDADGDGQPDPDFDTYVVQVSGPTLVDISVDGVGGAMGAFLALTDASNPAAAGDTPWRRFGVNIANDTSKRQMLFPAAGLYAIAVGDTRSMFVDADSPPAAGLGAAAGGPDAEYYMSITVRALPTPTPITITSGTSSTDGSLDVDKVDVYSVTGMGLGYSSIVADFPQAQSGGGVVLLKNNAFRSQSLESALSGAPANIAVGGIKAGDQSIVVIDPAYNYGPNAAPYNLSITTSDATALSTTGGTVSAPEISPAPASALEFNLYFYDVAAGDEIDGFTLNVNHPVDGVIADENLFILAKFTFDPNFGFVGNTFTDFKGLVRHPAPGRYYFVAYDPAGTPGTDTMDVTSTISTVTPAAVTENTPLTNQAVNSLNSLPFTYNAGNDPWQNLDITGVGSGTRTAEFYDSTLAYGALDSTTTDFGTMPPDPTPIFSHAFAAAPSKIGRILLDDGTTNYLVHVSTANATGSVTLDFSAKVIHDFGTIDAGNMSTAAAVTLDSTTTQQFFLFRTAAGNRDTLSATPVTGTLNTVVQRLNNDETALGAAINNGGAGALDSSTVPQSGNGWTAYSVSSATPLAAAATFDTTAKVDAAITYNVTDTTTAFDDACVGGATVTMTSADGFSSPDDEGLSASINTPAGFQFFGFDAPSFIVSTNGFLSFDTIASAFFSNADIPNTTLPNSLVAPYWDDLDTIVACTKASGTKLTIQWTGNLFFTTTPVQFQAILDSSDNSIEFVYSTMQSPTGDAATIGVEDQGGASGKKIGFNQANAITVGAGKKLTPM